MGGPGVIYVLKDVSEFQSYTVVGMWVHRVSSQASSIFRVTGGLSGGLSRERDGAAVPHFEVF